MNKKGFTLVEMLFVVVLIGIIATIVFPNIMDAVKQSKIDEYETTAKILRQSLELYNQDNMKELWDSTQDEEFHEFSINDLLSFNPSLKINEKCDHINQLRIEKKKNFNGFFEYQYKVDITCDGQEFKIPKTP